MHWDCADTSGYREIERQLTAMLKSNRYNSKTGVHIDSVETISINKDSTADANIYGKDESGRVDQYHLRLKLYPGGTFIIMSCQKSNP